MIHSNTSGYSPHPPVSVYGTGRITLTNIKIFLQVCLPALFDQTNPLDTVDFQSPYGLKPSIPSDGGSVTAWSQPLLHCEYWNINQLVIRFPSRVLLSPRLTLIRLTLFRKPWVFGVNISIFIIVTYAYICFSTRSRKTHVSPSTLSRMLPYHACLHASLASAAVLMPVHHPRIIARLVSCYALFE